MTIGAWEQVQAVFDRVQSSPPAERAAVLRAACGGDEELRTEVESLLEHAARAGDAFLGSPVRLRGMDRSGVPKWATALIGERIGRFTIVRLLGHGGMGCVFEAKQDQPARTVALKALHPGVSPPVALARFRLEAELLGRLQHPHIAQIFEAGVHEDDQVAIPYFAMELIRDAESLLVYAERQELTLSQKLTLFTNVCDAVQHGHQKGVIHRDLKPANILVGADGEPKVIDFGVARTSDADCALSTQHTRTGDLVGTVRYMSPEQCDGDPSSIDTRSDIYSLGVVLYELLTGSPPYDTSGTTIYRAVRTIKEQAPQPPGRRDRRLRGNVEAILMKALEKEPARRYASAGDLARDIRRHLSGEPIDARSPTWYAAAAGWMVRHPLVLTLCACAAVIAATAVLTWVGIRIATMNPHRVEVVAGNQIAQVKTAAGLVLNQWDGGSKGTIAFAELATRPPELGGDQVAILGYQAQIQRFPYGSFAFYDSLGTIDHPREVLALADTDIPEQLKERQRQTGRSFAGRDFGAACGILADVFDDPPGVRSEELVAVFRHYDTTQSAICVFRLDGKLLYRVWIDADIRALMWLPRSRLLVCAGRNGEAYWSDRRFVGKPLAEDSHPVVVFALRPVFGHITSESVAQESAGPVADSHSLRPEWYHTVHPPRYGHLAHFPADRTLAPPAAGFDAGETLLFRVSVAPLKECDVPILPERGWLIEANGTVHDYPPSDLWSNYGEVSIDPNGVLPQHDAFSLGKLPPIASTSR